MILTLGEARSVDLDVTELYLQAFEVKIRELTNNNFHNIHIRFEGVEFMSQNTIATSTDIIGLKRGDTIEVNYSHYNDGLYTVYAVDDRRITVEGMPFFVANTGNTIITKVEYPADIKHGILSLIGYDKKMASKTGIKSESISRMSVTYYDVNSTDNTDGYPSSMLSFLRKYEKMRW